MSELENLKQDLRAQSTPEKAKNAAWFFKTGPGEYGEGDEFMGVTVPTQRMVAKKYRGLALAEVVKLLQSPVHEERLTALFILVDQFQRGTERVKKPIYSSYLANARYINNWDLVDSSAEQIVGGYLADKDRSILLKLARSKLIWERRIAMIATYHYIKQGDATWALKVAEILINDEHDLIQKAVGWMLREVGKRCARVELEGFLSVHYKTMPRTALRYAIEHFNPIERQAYLQGKI